MSVQTQDDGYVVEYYYKVAWGHHREFIELFRKNHVPVLERETAIGRIREFTAVAPRYHGTEDGRWDYRVTIVFADAAAAAAASPVTESETEMRRLFPDRDAFEREEQRRFEILLAHWDLPVVTLPVR